MKTRTDRDGRTSPFRWALATLLIAGLAPSACSDATDVELLVIEDFGVVLGLVFVDLDGTGSLTADDEPLAAVGVLLLGGNGRAVEQVTTDSLGVFTIAEVPLGSYRLTLDGAALGDSLEVIGADDPIEVGLGDTTLLNFGATYQMLTLEEALAAPTGQRVFTSGIALNPRVNFGDGQVHFAGDSSYLRALRVERGALNTGDSVRILGRVVNDNGRPALDAVTPYVLVPAATLVVPNDVSVASASTADGASLDAALARIRRAEITDTSTNVAGDFRFFAVDGSDSVEVLVRSFLALNHEAFRPDTVVRINRLTGLLSPVSDGMGGIRWRLLPRVGADIVLETKQADVAVTIALDTDSASLGDTVEATVVASNAGPLDATLLNIQDTIPTALTFLSSTETSGSYDGSTGVWAIGTLAAGAADTLRVRMEVSDGTAPSINNVARSLGLTFEVDPNATNDAAVVVLIIS